MTSYIQSLLLGEAWRMRWVGNAPHHEGQALWDQSYCLSSFREIHDCFHLVWRYQMMMMVSCDGSLPSKNSNSVYFLHCDYFLYSRKILQRYMVHQQQKWDWILTRAFCMKKIWTKKTNRFETLNTCRYRYNWHNKDLTHWYRCQWISMTTLMTGLTAWSGFVTTAGGLILLFTISERLCVM
mgnify:CR=1 FL=1